MANICENLKIINENIEKAASVSGRKAEEILIMAVTKTVEPERINAAISAGIKYIGENRVQEFLAKREFLNLDGCEAHLIGHLQTNKVRQIVGKVDMIQSVDSLKVAEEIGKRSINNGIVTKVLMEINIGGEAEKFGFPVSTAMEDIYALSEIEGISVLGLMTVPPLSGDSIKNRKYFSNMYRLFVDIGDRNIDNVCMKILSMGMSGDYSDAVMEGANLVRIGSAIFGDRNY